MQKTRYFSSCAFWLTNQWGRALALLPSPAMLLSSEQNLGLGKNHFGPTAQHAFRCRTLKKVSVIKKTLHCYIRDGANFNAPGASRDVNLVLYAM